LAAFELITEVTELFKEGFNLTRVFADVFRSY